MSQPIKKQSSGPKTSGKATASLILGISSIIPICITGIIGIIMGILALGDISKSRGAIGGKGMAITGIILSALGILWMPLCGILIGMLLPAVQQVREAASRASSMNNVRQQVLGMHNYASTHNSLPKSDKNGLSWRVHILPWIDPALYDQFNINEPWDSPHNIALLDQMPAVYDCPNVELAPGMTVYQVPFTDVSSVSDNSWAGWASIFDNSEKDTRFEGIRDGTSSTIAVLEVDPNAAVEWTKPADWNFDPQNPMRDLGNVRPGVIVVGFADGAVFTISNNLAPEDFKALITKAGGEIVDPMAF